MIKLKDIIKENEDETVLRELERAKKDVRDMNDAADKTYREIYNKYVGMWTDQGRSDARQHTMFGQPSNAAHQMALQDPRYRLLKALVRTYENDVRKLEKRLKKIKK